MLYVLLCVLFIAYCFLFVFCLPSFSILPIRLCVLEGLFVLSCHSWESFCFIWLEDLILFYVSSRLFLFALSLVRFAYPNVDSLLTQHQVDDQLSGIMEQHQHHHRRRAPSKLDDDDVNIDEVDHLHGDMLHPATDGGDFMNVEYGDH